MNEFEKGEVITFDNGEKYVVVDSFVFNGKQYLYVIEDNETHKVAIFRYENGEVVLLNDQKEFQDAFNVLVSRNKKEIDKYLEEINEN